MVTARSFLGVMVDHGGTPQAACGPGEREARLPRAHRGRDAYTDQLVALRHPDALVLPALAARRWAA
jgi:hypothetical protein